MGAAVGEAGAPEGGLDSSRFRVLWILASAAGMAAAAAVARPLSYLVGGAAHGALGAVVGEAVVGAVAGGGVLGGVALAQWPLLRGRVSWAARWPAAGAAAGAAAAASAFAVLQGMPPAGSGAPGSAAAVAAAAAVVVGLAAFLLAHWGVLRRCVPGAGRLAAASAGGFAAAAVVTAAAGAAFRFDGGTPLFGALFGALLGALYGAVVVLVLGRRLSAAAR